MQSASHKNSKAAWLYSSNWCLHVYVDTYYDYGRLLTGVNITVKFIPVTTFGKNSKQNTILQYNVWHVVVQTVAESSVACCWEMIG